MSKVKIVQITYMGEDGPSEYLDDQGRVWYQARIKLSKDEYRYEWRQADLPEEPQQ